MARALLPLLSLVAALGESSTSPPSSVGAEPGPACPPRWRQFGLRCFAFFPVWSSWRAAEAMCWQTGGNLVSLHTPEERQLVRLLANTHTPVWLGGYLTPQSDSWFWSDNSSVPTDHRAGQSPGTTRVGGACMEMTPKSGELRSAPCDEFRFYICSTRASADSTVSPGDGKPAQPGVVAGVRLFDVVWSSSATLADEILRSSPFLNELRSGQLTERCYSSFVQQEALYLHRVSFTLKALIGSRQEPGDVRSLLLDTLKLYRSRNQSVLAATPPPWLRYPLQSFHSLVLEEPLYWLVALSARASLQDLVAKKLLRPDPRLHLTPEADQRYLRWSRDRLREGAWTRRFRQLMEEHRDQLDVFKAINIFRQHMMNQKELHRAAACDAEEASTRRRRMRRRMRTERPAAQRF